MKRFRTFLYSILVATTLLPLFLSTASAYLSLGNPTLGFDMEVLPRALRWLVPYIDLDRVEAWMRERQLANTLLTDDLLQDYVLSKEAFQSLPADLRQELSAGLNLERPSGLHQAPQKILNAQGAPVSPEAKQKKFLFEAPRIVKPTDTPPAATLFSPRPMGILPAHPDPLADLRARAAETVRSDWSELARRWNQLPRERKAAAVRLGRLTSTRVAEVLVRLPIEMKNTVALMEAVPLRADAPEWLRKLKWSLDGAVPEIAGVTAARLPVFEFALDGTEDKTEEAKRIVGNLLRAMKLDQLMARPQDQKRMDVAFHWHVSYAGMSGHEQQRIFLERLGRFKLLTLTRILAGGPQNDSVLLDTARFEAEGKLIPPHYQNIYDTPIVPKTRLSLMFGGVNFDKGLIRLVDSNHVEVREQTAHPNESLSEFLELFAISDEREFEKEISLRITKALRSDPTILQRILRQNPKILKDFSGMLPLERLVSELSIAIHQLPPEAKKEFANLYQALLELGDGPEVAEALLDLARERSHLIGGQLYRFLQNPKSREIFERAFSEFPERFDYGALHYLNQDRILEQIANDWPHKSEPQRAKTLSLLLAHRLSGPLEIGGAQYKKLLNRIASLPSAEGGSTFQLRIFQMLENPSLEKEIQTAVESGRYPGLTIDSLRSLFGMLAGEGSNSLEWYWNFWEYIKKGEPATRGALSAYWFIADRMEITDPGFYAFFQRELENPEFRKWRLSPMVQMLMPLRERGEYAREQVNALLEIMRQRFPEDMARMTEKRVRSLPQTRANCAADYAGLRALPKGN